MRLELPRPSNGVAALGLGLAVLGLAMMAGWVFRQEAIVRMFPGFLMVFNTALGFATAGAALAMGVFTPPLRNAMHKVAGIGLAALGLLVLAQYVLGATLGIDFPGLHTWLIDPGANRFPGRMSPATSIGFVLAGAVFLLASHARPGFRAMLVRALTAAVGALGALAAVGYLLHLDELFNTYWLTQVSLPTAFSFVALALGLWLDWQGEPWNAHRLIRSEDDRIALVGAMVLAAGVIATGVATFWLVQSRLEGVLAADLSSELQTRRALIAKMVERAIQQTVAVTSRPNILRIYSESSTNPETAARRASMPAIAGSLARSGFSAFGFSDAEGREIVRAGEFVEGSELRIPFAALHGARDVELLWDGNLVLEVRADIVKDGVRFGEVRGQLRPADLDGLISDVANLSGTTEFALCAPRASKLHCAPTRFQPRPFDVPATIAGRRLPMSYAFEGGTGVVKLTDYRGKRVVAAYTPLGAFGAGLVLKMDLDDLYAPIRERIGYLALTLLFVIVAASWILRSSVRPLARRLLQSEERLRTALEGSQFALWDWDLNTGRVYLSKQWSALLGGVPQVVETTIGELSALVHPEDQAMVREQVRGMVKGMISHYAIEHRVRAYSGGWKWIKSRGRVVERSHDGKAVRATGTNVDISERKHQQLQIAHQASHDALTGLPNRSLFHDRLERALLRSRRERALMAVMYIDVDKFKRINDTLGHAAGDALLKEFARRLSGCVRATDTVARLGGDEFAVILESVSTREDGLRIANGIVLAMRPQFPVEGGPASVSASVGIAFHDGTTEIPSAKLIEAADRALYETKTAGRDGFRAAA